MARTWALSLPDKELCLREALAVCTPPAPEPSAKRPGSYKDAWGWGRGELAEQPPHPPHRTTTDVSCLGYPDFTHCRVPHSSHKQLSSSGILDTTEDVLAGKAGNPFQRKHRVATRVSRSPLSGLKGVQPPLPFGRVRLCVTP